MIESISIRNFQRHKRLKLVLDPHVTTIVGKNDAGKSAIIRALRWVAFNRPAGTAHIRHGAKRASVTIRGDGHTIKRVRGKGRNIYQIDGDTLKAFGNDVPQEVQDLLNLSEINFQNQHDSPFWFAESAGAVSRQLNDIVDLKVIDDTLGKLASNLHTARAEEKVLLERVREARGNYKQSEYALDLDCRLQVAEEQESKHQNSLRRLDLLGELTRDYALYRRTQTRAANGIRWAQPVIQAGQVWRAVCSRQKALEALLHTAEEETALAKQPVPDLSHVETAAAELRHVRKRRKELGQWLSEARTQRATHRRTAKESAALAVELEEKIGKECPLCGKPNIRS